MNPLSVYVYNMLGLIYRHVKERKYLRHLHKRLISSATDCHDWKLSASIKRGTVRRLTSGLALAAELELTSLNDLASPPPFKSISEPLKKI